MDLQIVWFILVTVLFVGFFFLEGFDYGVGTILPFFAKNDVERRMLINSIGPVWDGNEVWKMGVAVSGHCFDIYIVASVDRRPQYIPKYLDFID